MIEFLLNENKKSLILFIHGFTGDKSTWINSESSAFPDLLIKDGKIKKEFDIAYFNYYSKLLNLFSTVSNIQNRIRKIFSISHNKLKKNISIDEISNLLRTELRVRLQHYDNIVLVAHSMGGLVAKSCIVKDLQSRTPSRIKLFISLAVPHMGSDLATFGRLFSKNIQIGELAPLNSFIHEMNDAWLKTSMRPATKYFYGVHDDIVPKTSAVPTDKETSDVISVDENHTSISKPKDENSTTYLAVKDVIIRYLDSDPGITDLQIQTLSGDSEYEEELFVLKLLMADVHNSTIRDAKEVFLNAEYARKIFSSESDQKRLADLYPRIRKIYKDSYTKYLHGGLNNSGQLVADVNERITAEDRLFLQTLIPFVSAIHKQGMLHQLANNHDGDIWWTNDQSMEALVRYLKDKKNE